MRFLLYLDWINWRVNAKWTLVVFASLNLTLSNNRLEIADQNPTPTRISTDDLHSGQLQHTSRPVFAGWTALKGPKSGFDYRRRLGGHFLIAELWSLVIKLMALKSSFSSEHIFPVHSSANHCHTLHLRGVDYQLLPRHIHQSRLCPAWGDFLCIIRLRWPYSSDFCCRDLFGHFILT